MWQKAGAVGADGSGLRQRVGRPRGSTDANGMIGSANTVVFFDLMLSSIIAITPTPTWGTNDSVVARAVILCFADFFFFLKGT